MNSWIVCYRKNDGTKDKPSTVQINRANIISISLYSDKIEIEFVNGHIKQWFFSEWEIKL